MNQKSEKVEFEISILFMGRIHRTKFHQISKSSICLSAYNKIIERSTTEKYVLGLALKVGRYLFCERIAQNLNYKSCGKNQCPLSIICQKQNSMNGLDTRAQNIY